MRMGEFRGSAGFAEKTDPQIGHSSERRRKQFDGDRAIQGHVTGEEYDTHSPAA